MTDPTPRALPERPDLDQLKKQAKALLAAVRRGEAGALARVVRSLDPPPAMQLAHAQWVVAREHGFASWRALKRFVEAVRSEGRRLVEATRSGDLAAMEAILDAHPELVGAAVDREARVLPTDTRAMRLLHVAVAADQPEVARLLARRGADLEARNADGRSALHDSLELGRDRVRDVLLEAGATVDVASAAILGDAERLERLLGEDPSLVADRSTGLSPLGWASYGGHPESLQVLVDHGARLTADETLAPASGCGHDRFVAAALAAGADPREAFGRRRWTALHAAAEMPHTFDSSKVVKLLLTAGADPAAEDALGRTPLDVAIEAARGASPGKRFDRVIDLLGGGPGP